MDSSIKVAERKFDWPDQRLFVHLSGDSNPIHMSEVAARRTQAGRPMLHGVNVVLWAMEAMASRGNLAFPIVEVKADFRHLMLVGETISVWPMRDDGAKLTAQIRAGETTAVSLKVVRDEPAAASEEDIESAQEVTRRRVRTQRRSGEWKNWRTRPGSYLCVRAPSSTTLPSPRRSASFALLSLPDSPGWSECKYPAFTPVHFLFMFFFEQCDEKNMLRYRVNDVDERFRMVTLSVRGPGVRGTVNAIARIPPVAQTSIAAIASSVARDEFVGATALIIGGSRGLGR